LEWEEDFTKIFEKLENVCGIIIESYQGWSAKFFNSSYIQKLVAWAKEHDILVCFDEIQGGFGRTGKLFAYEHYSIDKPDLICIGKGVSGSLPLSGVIGRADILDIPEVGSMSSTHSANPMSCIAGVLNLIEIRQEGLVDYAQAQGIILQTYLREHFGWPRGQYEINGKGLLAAILTKTTEEATEIVWECFKRGLLTIWTHKNSVKLAPPLTIKTDELLEGLEVLNDVLLMRQR
jgi:4-aminobutyrate aminotransferase-like enzyme